MLLVNAIVFGEEVESGVYVAAVAIVSRANAPHTGYGISTHVPYVATATPHTDFMSRLMHYLHLAGGEIIFPQLVLLILGIRPLRAKLRISGNNRRIRSNAITLDISTFNHRDSFSIQVRNLYLFRIVSFFH